MDAVMSQFAGEDEEYLVELSHQGPWKNTEQEHKMDMNEIEDYFKTFECNEVEASLAAPKAELLTFLKDFSEKSSSVRAKRSSLSQASFSQNLDGSS